VTLGADREIRLYQARRALSVRGYDSLLFDIDLNGDHGLWRLPAGH